MRVAPLVLFVLLCAGCSTDRRRSSSSRGLQALPGLASARSVGPGKRFRPSPTGALAARAQLVDGMRCLPPGRVAATAHIEVFAAGHVVVIPAGIGFASPLNRHGAYVNGGRCAYRMRTSAPTGLVLMEAGPPVTLGQFFDLWGQRLSDRTVAGFSAAIGKEVAVFINGSRWRGEPSLAPMAPRTQIAIEVGPPVPPHGYYTFPALRSVTSER